MFATPPSAAVVDVFADSLRRFDPVGFRAMARASADDLRPVLGGVIAPILPIRGDRDERAPQPVADELHATLTGSTLVTMSGVGHVCNLEAPGDFNEIVRDWLARHP